jgi:8-oxo-dGTP diphosphatase
MRYNGHWAFNVLAGAATVCGGRFLLLKRSDREAFLPAVWGIPAGTVKRQEDPGDTCSRELFEETGLKGEVRELIGYSTFSSNRSSVELTNIQLNFLVDVTDDEVALDPASHSAFAWIPLDEADNNELVDTFTRNIIRSARETLKARGTQNNGPGRQPACKGGRSAGG